MARHEMHAAMTVEEYLRFDESSPLKHEYVAGEVYAMTGVTLRHNTIARNIVTALTAAAAEGPCQVFFSDVRLRASGDVYYYPDAMVVCGDVDELDVIVTEPCVVIEVTSSSTGRIDRGEKLTAYRSISSVLAYLIVDHRRRRVERHWRADAASAWNRDEVAGHGTVNVPCLDVELSLDTIYRRVDLASIAEPDGAEYEADG
jgi:Uma2 family endonuclease